MCLFQTGRILNITTILTALQLTGVSLIDNFMIVVRVIKQFFFNQRGINSMISMFVCKKFKKSV